MLLKASLHLYRHALPALLLLIAVQSKSQSIGENPLMDMRVVNSGCYNNILQGTLVLDIQVCTRDGSNRLIQQLQNSLLFAPAFLPLVQDVQIQWMGFSAQNYHLQQQFTPGSGVIEFIANHYIGMDYTRLAGPLPSSWITVVRLTILFQLPTFELSVLNWYAYTPYYNVRAINPVDYTVETVHNQEQDPSALTCCSEASLAVELASFSAAAVPEGIQLQWSTACEAGHYGFWVQRSAALSGDWQTLNSVLIPPAGRAGAVGYYTFVDKNVQAGQSYYYRLVDVDRSGQQTIHSALAGYKESPDSFTLGPNYPNPFNGSTTIPVQIPQEGWLTLTVFDLLGRPVRTLLDRRVNPGTLQVVWNGADAQGILQPSATYFLRMRCAKTTRNILMQLSR